MGRIGAPTRSPVPKPRNPLTKPRVWKQTRLSGRATGKYPPLDLTGPDRQDAGMALVGLVRVASVARILGIDGTTASRWLVRMGVQPSRRPVLGMPGRTGTGHNGPLYISMEAAVSLVDRVLPGKMDRLARARARARLHEAERTTTQSTRGIQHATG